MAYVIPVVALVLDHQAAAAAINEPADYFDNPNNDRWDGVHRLQQVVGPDVTYFADEDGDEIFFVGIEVDSDWCIPLDATLANKVKAIKQANQHPLVQSATLAVVSQFN